MALTLLLLPLNCPNLSSYLGMVLSSDPQYKTQTNHNILQHLMETESLDVRYPVYEGGYSYYGAAQIVFLALLSLMTIYRREMSCNREYGEKEEVQIKPRSPSMEKNFQSQSQSMWNKSKSKSCPLAKLPDDVQIKCLSYLHPQDIINLSCTNRQTHEMVHNGDDPRSLSSLLWFQLFVRDYAWVLTKWKHGVVAVNQSRAMEWNCPDMVASLLEKIFERNEMTITSNTTLTNPPTMKKFYFMFAQTWMEYCIAGKTQNPTLVGIHGHVFDMSSFLENHPGSPETIIMQGGGKNTTSFFESVGHSNVARSLALNRLVEVVDLACCRGDNMAFCGLRDNVEGLQGVLPLKRSNTRIPGTLLQLRQRLVRDKRLMKEEARRAISLEMSNRGQVDITGDINVYFDPLCYSWKGWYLDLDFEPVFIRNIIASTRNV